MKFSGLGPNEFSEVRYVREIKVVDYAGGVGVTLPIIPIKAGTIVLTVGHEVVSAISGNGCTGITIGDSAAVNTFIAGTAIVIGTPGDIRFVAVPTVGAKKYAADDYIRVVGTVGVPSAGKGRLYIEMFVVDTSWRETDMPPALSAAGAGHPPMV